MKNVIQNIVSSITLQYTLAELRRFVYKTEGNSTVCKNIYLTDSEPLTEIVLNEAFEKVIRLEINDHVCYQVAEPKQTYLSAFSYCVNKKLINRWIQYFCLGELKSDAQTAEPLKRTKFVVDVSVANNIQEPQWASFIEYLQQVSIRQDGMCCLAVPSFTLEELSNDPYIAALAKEFPEIFLIIQTFDCMKDTTYFKILEIHYNDH